MQQRILVLFAELRHKRRELLHTGEGHGVVDGGAHAADAAVSLDAGETELLGLGDESLFEVLARQAEGDVHARAAALLRVSVVEPVRAVDGVVEECGLLCICLAHGGKAPVLLDPADGLADHVDREDGRGVVE